MIRVQEITKKYARNLAVDHISFEVQKGEIVGFLGPNGAGKTTTMRMLTCFLPPTSGTATVAGFDVLEQPLEVKKRIGYLPEMPPLYPEMGTAEYLSFVGKLKGLSGAELSKRIDYVSERCAIADVRRNSSAGCRKAIANAWAWPKPLSTIPMCSSLTNPPPVSTPSRSTRRATSSGAWPATIPSFSARTSFPKSNRRVSR